MRTYEIMFIVAPNAPDDEIDRIVAQMEGVVRATRGELISVERIGKRRLAYAIGKFEEGYYILFNLKGDGELVKEFERRLKVTDTVIRFVTVRVDEAFKRVEKIKTARLKKVRGKSADAQPEATASAL
jgi:small subunit ribosomal protein S6